MSKKGDLEKIKQIFEYVKQENISEEDMGGKLRSFFEPDWMNVDEIDDDDIKCWIDYEGIEYCWLRKLLDQMLHYNQIEDVKLPAFLVSELPLFLYEMSEKGDLEKIKQIFTYVNQENISVEEMSVKNNEVNQGKKPTLVDTNSGSFGRTPFISAASRGHHQICKYLITEQKANLEARDDGQNTALIQAAFLNKPEIIKVLLQNKANCKAKDKYGGHAAYCAAMNGYLDTLKLLVENDGDVIDLKGLNEETPLIAASLRDEGDVCKYLVEEKKANTKLKDNDGKTALQYAYNQEIIEILKKKT